MLFNSIDFLIFFPIVLFVYFVFPCRIRYIWLLAASYFFYMCWNPFYIVLILLTTVITYICGRSVGKLKNTAGMEEHRQNKLMKLIITAGFLSNIGMLVYFKYTNFLIETLNSVLVRFHIEIVNKFDILLPVGISFYIFQALGYIVDVYRGTVKAEKNFLRYALYVSFFPQLVAGPIERSGNLLSQIKEEPFRKLWNYQRVTSGLILMLWGYFLKVVIADRVAVLVNTVFAGYEGYQMTALWTGAAAFAIQIYCDFAGYSMIAIGAAKVLGFQLMENFDTPYFAVSVVDFWKRWHISLSTWFRDYLYIPLGGSRCSKMKKYRNILITFGVSGLWHGADWTYAAWGGLHGIYQIAEKELAPLVRKINDRCHTKTDSFGYRFFRRLVTFVLVDIAWIFFRADSIHQAVHYIKRMILYRDWWSLFDQQIYTLGLDIREMHILGFALLVMFAVEAIKYKKGELLDAFLQRQWIVFRWSILFMLLFVCIVFGYYGPGFDSSQFIYFQF